MNSIGEKLRQERLRRGLDLNQIAELTKISLPMLEAIEEDDFDRLPGSFFARSFVRQYAQALGLDAEEFESEVRRLAGFGHPAEDQPQLQPAVPEPALRPAPIRPRRTGPDRRSFSSLMAFLVIAAACTAIYGLWQKTHSTSAKAPQSAVATQQASPTPIATPAPEAETPSPTATPEETPSAEATASPLPETTPARPSTAPASPEASAIRLELRATSEAWVKVISDGKTAYSGVMQPNEDRVFRGASMVTLRVGNAAALAATYNGKLLGELGLEGQVRTIQFTPSGYEIVTPAPAAPPAGGSQPEQPQPQP